MADTRSEEAVLDYQDDLVGGSKSETAAMAADTAAGNLSSKDKSGLGAMLVPPLSMHTEFAQRKVDEFADLMPVVLRSGYGESDWQYTRASEHHAGYVADLQNFRSAEQQYNMFASPANMAVHSVERVGVFDQMGLGKNALSKDMAASHSKGFAKAKNETAQIGTEGAGSFTTASQNLTAARGMLLGATFDYNSMLIGQVISGLQAEYKHEEHKKKEIEEKIAKVTEVVSTIGEIGALFSGSVALSEVGHATGSAKVEKLGGGIDDSSGMVGNAVGFGMKMVFAKELAEIKVKMTSLSSQMGNWGMAEQAGKLKAIEVRFAAAQDAYNGAVDAFINAMGQQRRRYAQAGTAVDRAENHGKDDAKGDDVTQGMVYTSAAREARVLLNQGVGAGGGAKSAIDSARATAEHRKQHYWTPKDGEVSGRLYLHDDPDYKASRTGVDTIESWLKAANEELTDLNGIEETAVGGLKDTGMGSGGY